MLQVLYAFMTVAVATQNPVWHDIPSVVICPTSSVTVERAEKAVKYWKKLGHAIGPVRKVRAGYMPCVSGDPYTGTIVIDIPSSGFNFGQQLGVTSTTYDAFTLEIYHAKIEIADNWANTERLLEHELGHALGFRDNNTSGHMMNREWASGGHDSKGLEK